MTKKSSGISEKAKRIHSEARIIDIHCHPSLKVNLYGYKIYENEHRLGIPVPNSDNDEMFQMQYDLSNMKAGNISAIWSSVYVIEKGLIKNSSLKIVSAVTDFFGIDNINNAVERCDYPYKKKCYGPYTQALEVMEKMEKQISDASKKGMKVKLARNYPEFAEALDSGETCFIHTIEGAHMLGRNLSPEEYIAHLDTLKHRGVCSVTLGHFMPNNACFPANGISPKTRETMNFRYDYSVFADNGIPETGKLIFEHMLDTGIIPDLNHVNVKGRYELYEINRSRGGRMCPLVFTHNGVKALCRRELISVDDNEISILQECGGVIGVILMKYWLCGSESGPDLGIEHVVNTIKHISQICGGSFDNIAIGTDMDGFTQPVDDLFIPSQMIRLTQAMLDAGISEENIRKVLGENAMRVMYEGWGNAKGFSKAMAGEKGDELLNYFRGNSAVDTQTAFSKSLPGKKTGSKKTQRGTGAKKQPARRKRKELTALDPESAGELRKRFENDPEESLKWFQRAVDTKITMQRLREAIYEADARIKDMPQAAREIETRHEYLKKSNPLPPGFTFPGIDLVKIPIDPDRYKFETNSDILGWIIFSGPKYLLPANKYPFHSHDNHAYSQGKNFIDSIEDPAPGKPLDVAVFSDFGTGYYHSRYIAKQLKEDKHPYAVHLGDVYYSGTQKEFDDNFIKELDPILNDTCLFTLNSNHEMFSGSVPYFKYLVKRLNNPKQKQRGSYFCIRNTKFNMVGIDTDYHDASRYRNGKLKVWLENRLTEGRNAGQINILFSANEPYEHNDSDLTDLINIDLRKLLIDRKLVDLWFWGNVHYCALYDRSSKLPFIGSCVGHGGYPYYTQSSDEDYKCPVRVRFLETKSRFWKWPQMRQDVGNNGYCVMSLNHDGTVELKYMDWMRNLRCRSKLKLDYNNVLQIISAEEF